MYRVDSFSTALAATEYVKARATDALSQLNGQSMFTDDEVDKWERWKEWPISKVLRAASLAKFISHIGQRAER